jgi:hypothetical protein
MTFYEVFNIVRYFLGFGIHIFAGILSIFMAHRVIMCGDRNPVPQQLFVTWGILMFLMATMPVFIFLDQPIIKAIFEDCIVATTFAYTYYCIKLLRE